jgi:hypothetical protein
MRSEIKYKRNCECIGRNGFAKQAGLEVMLLSRQARDNANVNLSPIGVRGGVLNCSIEIPVEQLGEVIAALQAIHVELTPIVAP